MDDLTDILQLLRELPDFVQDLFPQLGEPLDTFTLFPKLPLELRLKVWRFCFPKSREILIGINGSERYGNYADDKVHELQRDISLPITLHICAESREETLRKYCLVWWKDIGREVKDWRRPICFDPERDMPFIVAVKGNIDITLSSEHIILLKSICGEQMKKITRLEVKRLDRYRLAMRTMRDRINKMEGPTYTGWNRPLEGVLQLSALKKVVFKRSIHPYYFRHSPNFDAESYLQRRQTTIAAYLKIHEFRFDNGKAPDILVKPERWHSL